MRVLVLLATLVAGTVSLSGQSPPIRKIADPESYEVYAAALTLDSFGREVPKVFLRGETRTNDDCLPSVASLSDEWRTVLSDYRARNRQSLGLDPSKLPRPNLMFTNELFDDITDKPGEWEAFWHEFPEGGEVLFQVSAVGFDPTKSRAILYLGHHAGGGSGIGAVYLLERQAEGWVPFLTMEQCEWASGGQQ